MEYQDNCKFSEKKIMNSKTKCSRETILLDCFVFVLKCKNGFRKFCFPNCSNLRHPIGTILEEGRIYPVIVVFKNLFWLKFAIEIFN